MNPINKLYTALTIGIVMGTMLLVKDIADRFEIIGAGSIAMWAGILCATMLMKDKTSYWKTVGLHLPGNKNEWVSSIVQAIGVAIVALLIVGVLTPLVSETLGITVPESASNTYEFFLGRPFVFVTFLVLVVWIGAAVGEELLIRGFLLNQLLLIFSYSRASKLCVMLAVVLHALIFGMLHISQGIVGVISTSCVAIAFATFYLSKGKKLFPLIMAHGLVNSIGLTIYYLTDGTIK